MMDTETISLIRCIGEIITRIGFIIWGGVITIKIICIEEAMRKRK